MTSTLGEKKRVFHRLGKNLFLYKNLNLRSRVLVVRGSLLSPRGSRSRGLRGRSRRGFGLDHVADDQDLKAFLEEVIILHEVLVKLRNQKKKTMSNILKKHTSVLIYFLSLTSFSRALFLLANFGLRMSPSSAVHGKSSITSFRPIRGAEIGTHRRKNQDLYSWNARLI